MMLAHKVIIVFSVAFFSFVLSNHSYAFRATDSCHALAGLDRAQCFAVEAESLKTQLHRNRVHLHYRDDSGAIRLYALAIQAYETQTERHDAAKNYFELGSLFALRGKHNYAVFFLSKALAILEKNPAYAPLLRAQTMIALGDSHAKLEIFGLAQAHVKYALAACDQFKLPIRECTLPAQMVMAYVYRTAQDFHSESEVFKNLQSALKSEPKGDDQLMFGLQSKQLAAKASVPNSKISTQDITSLQEAITSLKQYLRMIDIQSHESSNEVIQLHQILARLNLKMHQPDEALTHAKEAFRLTEQAQGSYAHSLVTHFNLIAQCHLASGNIDAAYEEISRAISLYWPSTSYRLRSESFDLLAQVMQLKENPLASIFYSKRALTSNLFAGRKVRLSDPLLGRYLVASRPDLFRSLAAKLFETGRLVEAEYALQYLKENEFQDFKHEFGDAMSDSEENTFEAPHKLPLYLLRPQLNPFEIGIPLSVDLILEEPVLPKEWQLNRKAFESAMEQHYERIRTHLSEIESTFLAPSARQQTPSEQTQNATDSKTRFITRSGGNSALLQYLVTDNRTYLLLHTAQGLTHYTIEITRNELENQIHHFVKVVNDPRRDPRPIGKHLYQLLIAPARLALHNKKIDNLLVSLDGPLTALPMAALFDGHSYLVERFSLVQYSPVSTHYLTDYQTKKRKISEVALLGLSQARAGFSALTGVNVELQNIQSIAKINQIGRSYLYTNDDFTGERLQKITAQHVPYIHIASHHVLNTNDADTSFLLLGNGKKLSISELKSDKFDFSGVELLTLSACNTGTGALQSNGLAMEGLGLILQNRGAKSILASKWAIDDLSTSKLMPRFYANLFAGMEKGKALRVAQIQFLKDTETSREKDDKTRGAERRTTSQGFITNPKTPYAHPYYWSGFVLMGDWL